jgi:hypothetical protein
MQRFAISTTRYKAAILSFAGKWTQQGKAEPLYVAWHRSCAAAFAQYLEDQGGFPLFTIEGARFSQRLHSQHHHPAVLVRPLW